MDIKDYRLFICSVPWLGRKKIEKLVENFGDIQSVYEAESEELNKVLTPSQLVSFLNTREKWDFKAKAQECDSKNINFTTIEEDDYPMRLKNIPDAPYGIFYSGKMVEDDVASVAVIGARDCSEYGRYVASALGRRLGEAGIQVISGMERGIDGISQIEAINAGGASFAVLGSGVDICYPEQNRYIYGRLKECGGIISEYPPGTPAIARNFPPRNRIVSGLADAIVVVEARLKSGTLITVDMALEQGKDVYVVPGRVTDRLSDGCNKLIKQGAEIFISPDEFITEIMEKYGTYEQSKTKQSETKPQNRHDTQPLDNIKINLPDDLKEVALALDYTPRNISDIAELMKNKKSISELSGKLMQLTLMGAAVQISPGHFALRGR
jgi:DNA processing protein